MTALHSAAYRGLPGLAASLIKRGAAPGARAAAVPGAHAGETPADTAQAQGHHDLARWLLRTEHDSEA